MPHSSAMVETQQGLKSGVRKKAAVEQINREKTECRVGVPPCCAHRAGLTEKSGQMERVTDVGILPQAADRWIVYDCGNSWLIGRAVETGNKQ